MMNDWFQNSTHTGPDMVVFLHVLSNKAKMFQPVVKRIFLVMLGGSLGALARYEISLIAGKMIGTRFAWGTLTANVAGCFLIGVAFALGERTNLLSPSARLFFMTGFIGALTTFSTYALETFEAAGSRPMLGLINFFSNNILGFVFLIIGMWAVRLLRT